MPSRLPSKERKEQQRSYPMEQQQPHPFNQVPPLAQLAALAGPAGGPAVAAAAELGVVGEKWFGDLQQHMKHQVLQQYINTAPQSKL